MKFKEQQSLRNETNITLEMLHELNESYHFTCNTTAIKLLNDEVLKLWGKFADEYRLKLLRGVL